MQPHAKRQSKRLGFVRPAALLLAAVTLASAWCSWALAGELRVWTSKDGKFNTIAEMVSSTHDTVTLEKHDGKVIRVPLSKLSEADQKYIRQLKYGDLTKQQGGAVANSNTEKKTPATIEREAKSARSAKDALLIYQFYMARTDLT